MSDNIAEILGGAVHSDESTISFEGSVFERNNSGETGGAVWFWKDDVNIDDCEFNENKAKYNGGAIGSDSTSLHIENSSFTANNAKWGGAVSHYREELHVSDCSLSDNIGEDGGAIKTGESTLFFTNVDFNRNSSVYGGGINSNNCSLEMESCSFTENNVAEAGGAMIFTGDLQNFDESIKLSIRDTDFVKNTANTTYGGLYIEQFVESIISSIEVDQCQFIENEAGTRAALQIYGNIGKITLSNSIFEGNWSHSNTSIFGILNGGQGEVFNCLFSNNQPRSAIVQGGSDVAFVNCTFFGSGGTALDMRRGAIARVANSIFWNNGSPAVLNTIAGLGCTLTLKYCNVQYGKDSIRVSDSLSNFYWGEGNITDDPRLFNTALKDYRLYYDSPCLEAGSMAIVYEGLWIHAPGTDIEENPRPSPSGTNPDMGAYESPVPAGIKEPFSYNPDNLLEQNVPNPFSYCTDIQWQQASSGQTKLEILDMGGRIILTPVNQVMPAGKNKIRINASLFKQGIYLYRLTNREGIFTKRMQVID